MSFHQLAPPFPVSNTGQNLLSSLRIYEKDLTNIDALEEVIDLLQRLISVTQRLGLLGGDESAANQIISSSQKSVPGSSSNTKRKKSSGGLVVHEELKQPQGATLDGQFVVQAVQRILSTEESQSLVDGRILLVALAADLCTATADSIGSRITADVCTVAEYEILASSGKQLLSNLARIGTSILSQSTSLDGNMLVFTRENNDEALNALLACLRACIAMVSLFCTKLSRTTKVLADLNSLGWKGLGVLNQEIVQASARLLAVLPVAGGTNNVTPSDLWNQCYIDAVACIRYTLQVTIPSNSRKDDVLSELSQVAKENLQQHVDSMKQTPSDKVRADSFVHRLKALSALCCCLLKREDHSVMLLESTIDPLTFLELVEVMLSVPLSAETIYHSTKKRLRYEPVSGGLLSPSVLVERVANECKLLGCELLQCLLSTVGGSTLLPYARRIFRTLHAALLTSCPRTVRKAVDPASEVQFSGKKQRRLHGSLAVRSKVIETFRSALLAFSYDPSAMASSRQQEDWNATGYNNHVDKSINLICGCLLDAVGPFQSKPSEERDEWGSSHEKVAVVVSESQFLATALEAGGEYLPTNLRLLLDSTALLCLGLISRGGSTGSLLSCTSVRVAFVELGCCCAKIPWLDGSMSSIQEQLMSMACLLRNGSDLAVSRAATTAIQLCDVLRCPRVPALTTVSRTSDSTLPLVEQLLQHLASAHASLQNELAQAKFKSSDTKAPATTEVPMSTRDHKKPRLSETDQHTHTQQGSALVQPATNNGTQKDSLLVDVREEMLDKQDEGERGVTTGGESKEIDGDLKLPIIIDSGPDEGDK